MIWTIYRHAHIASGKCYVGLTKLGMEARWSLHVSAAKGGSPLYFHSAIRKYGADAFSHDVLEQCPTLESASEAEIRWIAELHSTVSEFGYNLTPGGSQTVMTDEIKAKMGAASLAMWASLSKEEREARFRAAHDARRALSREEMAAHMAKMRESAKKRFAEMTDEERADCKRRQCDAAAKTRASRTPEERAAESANRRAGQAAMPEHRREERRRKLDLVREATNEKHRQTLAAKTAEERSACAHATWVTRHAIIAAACPAPSLRVNLLRLP